MNADDASDREVQTRARVRDAADMARDQRRALGWFALAAVVMVWWIVQSIAVGILLGALGGFVTQPVYERLKPRLGERWASLVTVLAALLSSLGFLALLSWAFISKGVGLAHDVFDSFQLGEALHRATELAGRVTTRFGFPPSELETKIRGLGEEAAGRAAAIGGDIAAASASALLVIFMMLLTMHYILRNWETVSLRAEAALPLKPEYSHALFQEFRRVGRTTLLGTIMTGLAQGLLATAGYAVFGVPRSLFFGVATAIASLIPAVGTLLVWVPLGVVMLLTGHVVRGVLVLAWGGLVVVGVSDYVIRPRLVGGEAEMPALATFAALFGGVEAFGLKGLILGPIMMSLAFAVLRIHVRESAARRAALAATPG